MANPLFKELNKNQNTGNSDNFVNSINDFASALRSKGDPSQMLQSLLNSGTMKQSQFNQLLPMAKQIVKNFGLK